MARNRLILGGILGLLLLGALLWWIVANQDKAFLHLCTSAASAHSVTQQATGQAATAAIQPVPVISPEGIQYWLGLGSEPAAQCDNVRIGVDVANITALYAAPRALLEEHHGELHLRGVIEDDAMNVNSVQGKAQPDTRPSRTMRHPVPLGDNVLATLTAQPFGLEERASVLQNAGQLTLHCTAGDKPAGAVLQTPWHLPQAELRLEVVGSGTGTFEVALVDEERENKEAVHRLGSIQLRGDTRMHFDLPRSGLNRSQWRALSIACPKESAQLELRALFFTPVAGRIPSRATWVWEADEWEKRPADIFAHAEKHQIKVLYIPVDVQDGAIVDAPALATFVREATHQGLQVWTVDGDPHMVLPDQHAATVARIKAYVAYNRSIDAPARLSGVQFDIEPYLIDNYDAAPEKWNRQYLALVRKLHREASGMPLEMAVPFWWGSDTRLLDALGPLVDSLAVMDYRTKAEEIYRFAVPFLDWGVKHRRHVRIALEAGPVDAETKWSYTQVDHGDTWLVPANGLAAVLQLRRAQANPHGPAFTLQGTIANDSGATTFYKKQKQLLALLPELEKQFAAWPAFSGMALHELQR